MKRPAATRHFPTLQVESLCKLAPRLCSNYRGRRVLPRFMQQEFKARGVCKVGRSADISVGEDLPCGPSHSESPTRHSDGLIVIGQVMFSHSGKPKLYLAGR